MGEKRGNMKERKTGRREKMEKQTKTNNKEEEAWKTKADEIFMNKEKRENEENEREYDRRES